MTAIADEKASKAMPKGRILSYRDAAAEWEGLKAADQQSFKVSCLPAGVGGLMQMANPEGLSFGSYPYSGRQAFVSFQGMS